MPLNNTPCPKCSKRTDLVAGINDLPRWKDHQFLVCWKCNRIKHVNPRGEWLTLKEAKKRSENAHV